MEVEQVPLTQATVHKISLSSVCHWVRRGVVWEHLVPFYLRGGALSLCQGLYRIPLPGVAQRSGLRLRCCKRPLIFALSWTLYNLLLPQDTPTGSPAPFLVFALLSCQGPVAGAWVISWAAFPLLENRVSSLSLDCYTSPLKLTVLRESFLLNIAKQSLV